VTGARGSRVAGSFANRVWQMLGGSPNLRGKAPTRGFHPRLRFPVPFNGANVHAGLAHVVLTIMLETDVALFFGPIGPGLCTILHLDFGEFSFWALG
jgi:hypothetical protein